MQLNLTMPILVLALGFAKRLASGAPLLAPTPQAPPRPPVRPPTGSTMPPGSPPSSSPHGPVDPASVPPWPQVVPAGLPSFPGPGWVPDSPPGPGVVVRAKQLLPELWRRGAGAYKVENTAGRWIAYKAQSMGAKKGVVAFRERTPVATAPDTATLPVPASTEPVPSVVEPAKPPPIKGVRTLRLTSPRMTGHDVTMVQRVLTSRGFTAGDDGIFGTGTDAAARAFQRSQGLTPDGVVGPKTWGALFVNPAGRTS